MPSNLAIAIFLCAVAVADGLWSLHIGSVQSYGRSLLREEVRRDEPFRFYILISTKFMAGAFFLWLGIRWPN